MPRPKITRVSEKKIVEKKVAILYPVKSASCNKMKKKKTDQNCIKIQFSKILALIWF